ncbi:S8 family serine peptidase [Paenibacillus mucilaginosus]|uniref:Nisin leader peptide-processing serine protease NisP n=3 Tax=Paenibacillus mucilaginosus TaxID=61624 RepID=H6NJW8_9BACL|nr:S8 family serine peptidase [Paenibacillus mucilaginosus]AEI41766.1 nisin leader peptide-processing serine protease NisP [Paenibacillus mucilaginosus KNP414]AFC30272.1 nisin leader peptide-processing serine protease NisP [Paenibacillus mucilaginosus 3016]AFH62542.1 peptidase [Paenibacillus mucilaginosus K02]MCG7214453.1 S8 family serine peptidase [Paenibacillus mucilaginosus]WDM30736.1 S8 family serine peptidase [Paenibacillus mucilaginosus]
MRTKVAAAVSSLLVATSLLAGVGYSKPAAPVSQKHTYVIAFQSSLPANYESIVTKAGGKVLRALPELGGLEVESDRPDFLSNLSGVSGIRAANREMVHKLDPDPAGADGLPVTDIPQNAETYWPYQWDIQRVTNNGASYKLETGGTKHADGTVRHKAVVGVIDSGIDANHPDLKANFLGGMNFVPAGVDASEKGDPNDIRDRDGHGTHVAGSIAANGKVKGVGPDLGIRSYRVFAAEGGAPTSWIAAAIVQAANDKVDVINMSIGGFDGIARYTYEGLKYSDVADMLLWKRAVQYAVSRNVTVVAAAGNEELNLNDAHAVVDYMNQSYGELGFTFKSAVREVPGTLPGVINVSSSNQWSTDHIAFYSNYGSTIDVAAPGGDNGPVYDASRNLDERDFHYRTLSTWPTYLEPYFTSNLSGYALLHGTSMAAPKVAGIAGVIKAAHPEYTPAQVQSLIKQTAVDLGKSGQDPLFGTGEANIYKALSR